MTEDKIEAFALERLEALRYGYAYGPTIAPRSRQPPPAKSFCAA